MLMSKSEINEETSPLGELGLIIETVGDDLHAHAEIVDTMCSPGTSSVRVSILAAWTDTILGLLAMRTIAPRVPVTVELDVQLFGDLTDAAEIRMTGRLAKAGSVVQVYRVDIATGDGRRVGFGHSLFMAAPDAKLSIRTGDWAVRRFAKRHGELTVPFAERIGCRRIESGVAELPLTPALLNSSNTMNGGLLALVVEEAALSAAPDSTTLSSMHLRYLRPVRSGPAVGRAEIYGDLGEVEVRDASTDTVSIVATTRFAHRSPSSTAEIGQTSIRMA